jgi:hypothetical protein
MEDAFSRPQPVASPGRFSLGFSDASDPLSREESDGLWFWVAQEKSPVIARIAANGRSRSRFIVLEKQHLGTMMSMI